MKFFVVFFSKEAATLREKGVRTIIALGHSGMEKDIEIAKKCPLVDLVVGGHSHTYHGQKQDVEDSFGPYPIVVEQANGKQVPVVQAYAFTKYMGYIKLKFNNEGKLLQWEGSPILLDSKIPKELDVLKVLDKYRAGVEALGKTVIGKSMVLLNGHTCRFQECNMGNLITDAMLYQYARNYSRQDGFWTDASIAIIQSGGIRASIDNGTNITQLHLNTVLPFGDRIVLVDLTGKELLEVLEHSVHR